MIKTDIYISKIYKNIFLKSQKPYNKISILTSLIVPLLVTGPFLSDLLLSSLVVWFLYLSILKKIFNYYKNNFFYLFLIFNFFCITSSIFSDNVFFSFQSSLFYFRIGIFVCLISFLIDKNKNILKYFYYSFTFTFTILIVDGFIQYIFGQNIFGQELIMYSITPRVTSFFGDETVMDSFLARLFPLYFGLFVIKKNKTKKEKFFMAVIFILLDILIYLGGGRTSFFFLNLSTIFIIIFISKYKKLRFFSFLISIVIISVLTINDDRLISRYLLSPIESTGINSNNKYIFSEGHDSHIRTALKMFIQNPILGVGPKMFRKKCNDEKYSVGTLPCSTHPHNFYAQLLAETGIIGFMFITIFLFFLIYKVLQSFINKAFKKKSEFILNDYQICILAAILITLWPLSPNGNFFNNWLMIVYSLSIGFYKKKKLKF